MEEKNGQIAVADARAYYDGMFRSKEKPLEPKEFPDEADIDDGQGDSVDLSQCGACGDLIYEDTPRCPRCGEWIVQPGQRWRQSDKWYVRWGLLVGRTIVLNWVFLFLLACVGAAMIVWRVVR